MTLNYKEKHKELRIAFKRYLLEQGIQLVDLSEYAEKGIADWWLSHLSEVSGEWEEEFYEKFGIPGTSVFSFTNAESFFVIKGFISSLLSQKQAEIIILIEGMKINSRKLDPNRNKETIDRVRGYNSAIRDILKDIKK